MGTAGTKIKNLQSSQDTCIETCWCAHTRQAVQLRYAREAGDLPRRLTHDLFYKLYQTPHQVVWLGSRHSTSLTH